MFCEKNINCGFIRINKNENAIIVLAALIELMNQCQRMCEDDVQCSSIGATLDFIWGLDFLNINRHAHHFSPLLDFTPLDPFLKFFSRQLNHIP